MMFNRIRAYHAHFRPGPLVQLMPAIPTSPIGPSLPDCMIQTIPVVRAKHIPLSPSLQRFACVIHKSPLLNVRFAFQIKKALKPAAERTSYPQPHVHPMRITTFSTARRCEGEIPAERFISFPLFGWFVYGEIAHFPGRISRKPGKSPG